MSKFFSIKKKNSAENTRTVVHQFNQTSTTVQKFNLNIIQFKDQIDWISSSYLSQLPWLEAAYSEFWVPKTMAVVTLLHHNLNIFTEIWLPGESLTDGSWSRSTDPTIYFCCAKKAEGFWEWRCGDEKTKRNHILCKFTLFA